MANCYSGIAISGEEQRRRVAAVEATCKYLPLFHTVTYNGHSTELQLCTFSNDREYEQGYQLMNDVIEEGRSWPFIDNFNSIGDYRGYFHSHAAFLVRFKDTAAHGSDMLGCFYIKPNFPGRCSHICNGGFISNPAYRGLGVGSFMGTHFKRIAKDLGYRASLFNLVFANNVPSLKLWRKLGYRELAVLPKAASLKGIEGYVDAVQFYCDFYADDEGLEPNASAATNEGIVVTGGNTS